MTVPNIVIHGQGKPLVLFHGWGFDLKIWLRLCALSTQYQLYLVDLPGFGLTPPMEWEGFKSSLLKQLPEKFALLGWSMGGLYATKLALAEPSRVTHLLNITSSPCFIQEADWPGIAPEMFNKFYQTLASNPEQTIQEFIALQLQGQKIELGQIPSMEGLRAGLDLLMSCDLRKNIIQLDMPVCYMFGRLDAIVPRTSMVTMQTLYPHFKYTLFAKAAHAPFLSHPSEFVTELEKFLL